MKKTKLLACALCAMSLTAAAAGAANTVTAVPTRETGQTVYFDASSAAPLEGDPQGLVRVYPTAYNIGGSNYFKLRDLAALIGFSVDWDSATGTVLIAPRRVKSDLSLQDTATSAVQATASTAVCKVGRYQTFGAPADYSQSIPATIQTYNIGGNNYVKLRDIADLVKFEVKFDTVSKTVDLYKYNNGSSEVRKLATDNAVGSQSTTTTNNTAQSTTTTNNTAQSTTNANTSTTAQRELMPLSDELHDKLVEASLKYVNEERAKVGSAPLQHNPLLTKSAKWWAEQMASTGVFRHTNGADLLRMEQEYGIYAMDAQAAENIAKTPVSSDYSYQDYLAGVAVITEDNVDEVAKKVVDQFVNSPAHYATMTDKNSSKDFIGFGFALYGNMLYSVQHYGHNVVSRGSAPFWKQIPEEITNLGVKVENGKTIYYLDLVNYPFWSKFEGQVPEIVFD